MLSWVVALLLVVSCAFASTIWIAGGTTGMFLSNDVGATWTPVPSLPCAIANVEMVPDSRIIAIPSGVCAFSFAIGTPGVFVVWVCSFTIDLAKANDPGSWVQYSHPALAAGVTSLALNETTWIATLRQNASQPFGQRPAVVATTDAGLSWKAVVEYAVFGYSSSQASASAFVKSKSLFLVTGYGSTFGSPNTVMYSRDGLSWTGLGVKTGVMANVVGIRRIHYCPPLDKWFFVGTRIFVTSTPTNASSWKQIPNPLVPDKVDIYLGDIAWCGDKLVLGGGRGGLIGPGRNQIAVSRDGISWQVLADRPFISPYTVLYVRGVACSRYYGIMVAGQGPSQFAHSQMGVNGTFAVIPNAAPFIENRNISKWYTGANALVAIDV